MRGGYNKLDLTGQRFTRWTVVKNASHKQYGKRLLTQWLVKCECGVEKVITTQSLRSGTSKSCGCFRVDNTRKLSWKHGHATGRSQNKLPSPEFRAWTDMRNRCTRPKVQSYKYYGGRGISVCDRWMKSFIDFLADMGPCPPGYTIERKDNDGNYEPANCCWVTRSENCKNRRKKSAINVDTLDLAETD